MEQVSVEIPSDGPKNVTVIVSGFVSKAVQTIDILTLANLNPPPKGLRIESITFAIEEKSGFYLWWKGGDSNKSLILPLESRGFFDFEKSGNMLSSPEGTVGLVLTPINFDKPKAFFVLLDMGKQ